MDDQQGTVRIFVADVDAMDTHMETDEGDCTSTSRRSVDGGGEADGPLGWRIAKYDLQRRKERQLKRKVVARFETQSSNDSILSIPSNHREKMFYSPKSRKNNTLLRLDTQQSSNDSILSATSNVRDRMLLPSRQSSNATILSVNTRNRVALFAARTEAKARSSFFAVQRALAIGPHTLSNVNMEDMKIREQVRVLRCFFLIPC